MRLRIRASLNAPRRRATRCGLAALAALPLLASPAHAQVAGSREGLAASQAIFQAPDLPTPNGYRAASGAPGPDYWQQGADYRIEATLDPAARRIDGHETITYTNHSPEALDALWLQLDQNLFAAHSRGAEITPPNRRFAGAFSGGGFQLSDVRVRRSGGGDGATADYLVEGTRMRIPLDEPLAPGASLDLSLAFTFTIPQYGADRMGWMDAADGTVFELAQWYPRISVYDDVHGWNTLPYLGQGEFYLEYGSFDVELTVPRDLVVAATGTLTNPEEVLTAEQRRRLERARDSRQTVTILGRDEVGTSAARPAGRGALTWKFHADNVRDFSWAASSAFIWDAAGYDGTIIQSLYPKEGLGDPSNPGWERATEYARHTIEFYSKTYFPYPYPSATNIAGIVRGMEYPQIVFCGVGARGRGLFGVTDHELGHSWFPMIVGSDERRHAWMDEGFNTFINYYSGLAFYGDSTARGSRMNPDTVAARMQQPIAGQPIETPADRVAGDALGFLQYRKVGAGLVLLREYVLGPERFDPAFREYIRRWAYRHPQPADFFRTMENITGEDLGWFWHGWFTSTGKFDIAITGVETAGDTTRVHLENQGSLVMPVDLEVTHADGSRERRRVPVEAWYGGGDFVYVLTDGPVVAVAADPDHVLPDVDRDDETWRRAP
ncbi:MAG: M1 family metallopeptidase [Gemmatimonadales bacterium]|jgi:hypothetical protein